MLGPSAIAARKLECGMPLTVLGVSISLEECGLKAIPDKVKCVKWIKCIEQALASGGVLYQSLCSHACSDIALS